MKLYTCPNCWAVRGVLSQTAPAPRCDRCGGIEMQQQGAGNRLDQQGPKKGEKGC
jgi:hypothetical protein